MINHQYVLQSFSCLGRPTASRLHNMGLCEGCSIKVIQRYPFHGPVIIENNHQRIGIRYRDFAALTEVEA
ncbi:FeoA family protein [uncultured Limosilactobacillus sp.]|uniref:FeoA family protein n=1 Tax=uncultured Limosilactobacillus sp. TaxID=2837629 RepID=UPI0025939960|nr:FeoA family protein [uncultured Limosilactobacillus sp.]